MGKGRQTPRCCRETVEWVANSVGETGEVVGLDRAAPFVEQARQRTRQMPQVRVDQGDAYALPYPDQSFDAVLSTLMMHHLPDDLKRQGLAEIARVLKPGGRLLVVDARRPEEHHDRPARLVGPWNSGIQDQPALMKEAGFSQVETGAIPFRGRLAFRGGLGFALGRISGG